MRVAGFRLIGSVVCYLLVVLATGRAQAAEPFTATLDIEFVGTSTLHEFTGRAAAVTVAVEPEDAAATAPRPLWRADIEVPVAGLETGIGQRDAGMRAMLQADAFPLLRGTFRRVDPESVRATGRLPFVLTIRAVARDITAAVTGWEERGDRLAFAAAFEVSLASFGLEAPRALLFLRVGDVVRVLVRATVRRAAPGPGRE